MLPGERGERRRRSAERELAPAPFTNGRKTPKEEMREVIDSVKPKAPRKRLLKVWAKW
jgi:hypothetical protein